MTATLDLHSKLTVYDGLDVVAELGQARGRDRRARRLHSTRMLRDAGYGDLGPWQTLTGEEAAVRTVGSAPPPRPVVEHVPSAPDPDVPAPAVGDVVMPRAGIIWCGRELRVEPSEVVNVHDYRPELAECVVVIQPAVVTAHFRKAGHPINHEHGAYVGLADVTPVADG